MRSEDEEEEEEEEDERRTWIDDNDDAWALIDHRPGQRPFWRNSPPGFLPVAPAVGATAGLGRDINTGRRGGTAGRFPRFST